MDHIFQQCAKYTYIRIHIRMHLQKLGNGSNWGIPTEDLISVICKKKLEN